MLIPDFNNRKRRIHQNEEQEQDYYVPDEEQILAEDACTEGRDDVAVGVVDEEEVGPEDFVDGIYHNEHSRKHRQNLREHLYLRLEAARKEHDGIAHKKYMEHFGIYVEEVRYRQSAPCRAQKCHSRTGEAQSIQDIRRKLVRLDPAPQTDEDVDATKMKRQGLRSPLTGHDDDGLSRSFDQKR